MQAGAEASFSVDVMRRLRPFAWDLWATDAQPRKVGPYELSRQIGHHGGMGVVYFARHLDLNRPTALKWLLNGPLSSPKAVARFYQEGKAISRLDHPNVVRLYDFDRHEGLPYLAMELVDGGSLQAKLAEGPMEPVEAAALVRTLALAADYAHRKGVVHRDLKPANILLTRDGTPKISDFGVAKLLDVDPDGTATAHPTESGTILGTANYMSPEQASGSKVDATTDVYALGAILYHALTGQPPFAGETRLKALELVRTTEPPTPSSCRPGIPPWLEAICLKCLEKSPARRYATAQALADDLDRWLRDQRPVAVPGPLTRLGRGFRRNLRRYATAALLVSALASAGAVVYLRDPNRMMRETRQALDRGRAVTLVGKTGYPIWSRRQVGKQGSEMALADDGAMTVQSWSCCLLELVPDPGTNSYRFAAQVRHEKSDEFGDVGLYFARRTYAGGPAPLEFFTQLAFNGVRFPDIPLPPRPVLEGPLENEVLLRPHLVSDAGLKEGVSWKFFAVPGPRFEPLGESNGRWHDLEVTVTPSEVTARWDGQAFSTRTETVKNGLSRFMKLSPPKPGGPVPMGFVPIYDPRGGLGLYVYRGLASFRAVTLTPLPARQ
jgi:serine/threonine-protein kinase